MAFISANLAFNFDNADLSRLDRFAYADSFLNDINVTINGRLYPDLYEVNWRFNNTSFSSVFGGVDLAVFPGQFIAGTATGYLESVFNGAAWTPSWGLQDVAVPANSIYQAALTPSTIDDYALVISMLAGDDTANMSPFADLIRTFGGQDSIFGGGGNDFIDGGTGRDTSIYSRSSNAYKLVVVPGSVSVQDRLGSDGTDILVDVEQVRFLDQTLDTTWFSKAAAVPPSQFADLTDMYIAYFDRAPDAVGLFYWASRLKDGMTLQEVAKSFFVQPETIAAYPPGLSTTDFVTKVYNNVLGRDPDVPGLNYWTNSLQTGGVSKDEFMLAIIYGARAATGSPADVQYLANKNSVGRDFAVAEGLSNVAWAKTVMADVDGSLASVQAAFSLTDGFAATAASPLTPDLVVQLVGIA